jgi:hypothetical protein
MGLKRDSGRGSFVESVMNAAETFYGDVLQKLRPWKAAPPKLKKSAEKESPPETVIANQVGVDPESIADLESPPAEEVSETADVAPEAE